MKEQSPVKEDCKDWPDTVKEQLMTVLQRETKFSQVQSAVNEGEAEMQEAQQQIKVEALKKEDAEIENDVFCTKQNIENGTDIATEDVSPKQALGAQFESLQTEDSIPTITCPVQEKTQISSIKESVTLAENGVQYTTYPVTPAEESVQYTTHPVEEQIQSLEESVTPAEPSIQETTPSVQEQIQIPRAEDLVTDTETAAESAECWDEYLAQNDGASNSELVFASLLANTQNIAYSRQHDTETGWHFPAGPGLADEVQCPLWQFPAVSYYPPAELTVPFEGENLISPFTLITFPLLIFKTNKSAVVKCVQNFQ